MKRALHSIYFLLLVAVAPTEAREADSPLSPEQTLQQYRLSDVQISPDGHRVAFSVTEPVDGASRNTDVWVYDRNTGELLRFTTSDKPDRSPRWSPDGASLAFLSGRDGKTQVYRFRMRGGEPELLTEHETDIRSFAWSPDGSRIAFLAQIPLTEEEKKKEAEKDDARVEDAGDRHAQLWVLDIDSRNIRRMTDPPWRVAEYAWLSVDRLIAKATDHPHPELETEKLYFLSLRDSAMMECASPPPPFSRILPSPDGRRLAFIGTHADGPQPHDLCILDLEDGISRNLTRKEIDRPVDGFVWLDASTLTIQASDGFGSAFYHVRVDGGCTRFAPFEVQPMGAFDARSGLTVFVGQTSTRLPELYASTRPREADPISRFHIGWSDRPLIEPEVVSYPGFDGMSIEASLFKPMEQQGTPRPAVLLIHGGPSGRWADRFNSWAQLLAARGFAVLCPNIRGSSGYGYDFMAANRRDWGGADFRDVMAGVDFLIAEHLADSGRVGIGGWSYGGYMAAWAVTQTDRFAASVSGAPMTDLAFEYGAEEASINAYDTWYMGTPYENLELFTARSPMTFIHRVKTPTLILCGENDSIDPVEQCRMFHRGLKRYGVDTEFVIYPREGHGIREEKHVLDSLDRIVGWFEKYLRPASSGREP